MSSSSSFDTPPTDPKNALMQQVRQEAALANARTLVQNINRDCYEKCVAKPAGSLSSGEEKCFIMCMEKYMDAWNTTSRAYVARLQQENAQRGMLGANFPS